MAMRVGVMTFLHNDNFGSTLQAFALQRALTELEREGLLVGGGTTGRTVTQDRGILSSLREDTLGELARECAEKFAVFGVSPAQAAELLKQLEEKEEEI